jgi:hypothetical protein
MAYSLRHLVKEVFDLSFGSTSSARAKSKIVMGAQTHGPPMSAEPAQQVHFQSLLMRKTQQHILTILLLCILPHQSFLES